MVNLAPVELLVDGRGSVNGEHSVSGFLALTDSKVGSEQQQSGLAQPLRFIHSPKGLSSHSQLPQPFDDELDELEEGVALELELDERAELELEDGIELDELELLMVISLSA
jgi:hypothetical protein